MTATTVIQQPAQPPLDEIVRLVLPKPDELRWQDIPWQTDVRAARRIAAEQRKPIFLWAMNGNPLGCT